MPVSKLRRGLKNVFMYRVLHVDDTPHRIALGVAVGMFVAWTPTIGFQMVLTVLLATLLGANKLVGVPCAWISNPLTLVPIYYPNYRVGRWLLGHKDVTPTFLDNIHVPIQTDGWLRYWIYQVQIWWSRTWEVFLPLWLGSVVVGLVLGGAAYFVIRWLVTRHRRRVRTVRAGAAQAGGTDRPGAV